MRTTVAYAVLFSFAFALSADARRIRVPAGTPVYGELDEKVTSRTKRDGTSRGDLVHAHVWRDVVVDGRVVIPAGAPMMMRVGHVRKSNFAGVKGKLEIDAISVELPDGSELPLSGGYDKSGHGRKALSITLAAVVAWPLIFIKGKHAVLDRGTVFDAAVRTTTELDPAGQERRKISLSSGPTLDATVLYDAMDSSGKSKQLPVRLEACDGATTSGASVVTINDSPVNGIRLEVTSNRQQDGCEVTEGNLNLKQMGKHFGRGINRFEIEAGGLRQEIILDIEL